MKTEMGLGPYLKRLRESNNLSLRQVTEQAKISSGYLSQIEGEKRGKRKGGEYFAPHPQILQKLARVYHVEAHDLLERAGYLQEAMSRRFSEEREMDRCFDFVIHDPALKEIFTLQDKRAVIERYEAQTGRKVLTWAAHPTSMRKKATYQGLHLEGDRLYADTVDMALTVAEVAEELEITEDEVRELVTKKHLPASQSKGDGPHTFSRLHLLGFQARLHYLGLKLVKAFDAEHTPKTSAQFGDAGREILEQATQEAVADLRAKANRKAPKRQSKGKP